MQPNQTPPWGHLFAGAAAGTCAALVTCPLDVLKTRLQSSEHTKIGGLRLRTLAAQIVKEEGCVCAPVPFRVRLRVIVAVCSCLGACMGTRVPPRLCAVLPLPALFARPLYVPSRP